MSNIWIQREISPELRDLAREHAVVVLTGPRQVGKTSLLERLFPDYDYVSLDLASNAEMAESRPSDFLAQHPPPVVIDEVQYAPGFFRDIKTAVDSRRDFERLLRAAAARCGQTLNMSELARDIGIAPSTARQWISVLQASNQILLLEPYHRSLGKRLAKSPKLYFTDTGLVAFLLGFQSADAMMQSPLAGALWENHVIVQWLRWRDWHQPAAALWYWRNQTGDEVDLVIETNARLYAVECKLAERPTGRAARGIHRMQALYGADLARGYIACTTANSYDLADKITAVNAWRPWALAA